MRTDVTRLDLVGRRRALLGYSVGAALYAFVIVALYPSFEHSTGLDSLTKNSPTIAALLGAVGSITSPAGWLSVNLYANFFPLLVLLATIGYGASSLAGQDEEGTLESACPGHEPRVAQEVLGIFGYLVPGEVRAFTVSAEADARTWVSS